jgi:hypothetical protein
MTEIQVCDIVLYTIGDGRRERFRVTHHLRRVEDTLDRELREYRNFDQQLLVFEKYRRRLRAAKSQAKRRKFASRLDRLNQLRGPNVARIGTETALRIAFKNRERERQRRQTAGLPCTRRYKLLYCRPEEATHLSLYGCIGAEVAIAECEKVGTVAWSAERIAEAQADAVRPFWLDNNFPIVWEWE